MQVTIPELRPHSPNDRVHHMARARARKRERKLGRDFVASMRPGEPGTRRYTITLLRIGKRKVDSDNLQAMGKGLRDGIADALGIDDGDERHQWVYEQDIAKRYEYRISITWEDV